MAWVRGFESATVTAGQGHVRNRSTDCRATVEYVKLRPTTLCKVECRFGLLAGHPRLLPAYLQWSRSMIGPSGRVSDTPVLTSSDEPAAPLESIIRTDELDGRPSRPQDHASENRALAELMSALSNAPATILQTLADKVLEVLQAGSAGLSLLTRDEKRFYWAAISGGWQPHKGGGTPRDFGPCGDVLDRDVPMLFTHWERRYPYLGAATPLAEEGLLVPFHAKGRAVGTIWAIAHTDKRKFDKEDLRLLESLGRFASAAYQTVTSIDDLRVEIAAREKAEAELRQFAERLEAKLRCLVDASIMGVFIWNLDGKITDVNDAFLRIVGHDRETVAQGLMHWTDLTPTEWRDRDRQALEDLAQTGTAQPYEKEFLRGDGVRVPVLLGAALFEKKGREGAAFVLDLTDSKRVERAAAEIERHRNELQTQLAHANRLATLGQLSASIAHEVNQPIAASVINAKAGLRWLKADPPELDETRRALDRVLKDGSRAAEVVDRIRLFARKAIARKKELDINRAIVGVVALISREASKNGVEVRTQLAEGLPLVLGDRVQIQQVILNLAINAVEAMSSSHEGSRELLIATQPSDQNYISVAVQDSGPGLSEESRHRLFEPFYTTKSSGLGIGLSICRSIVEAHGGRLSAAKSTTTGATFKFTMPLY